MRALRFHAAHDVRVEEVPEPPTPGAGEVLVAPVTCGICGTDLHEYTSGPLRTPAAPHPLTGATLPQILGHELAGTVIAVGPGVRSVAPEDRVSVMPLLTCGACRACRSGRAQHCELRACVGLRHPWGGMADRALVTEHQVARLPDAVSWTAAVMIEPLAVSASAVAAGGTAPGDAVLITGAGPIGALAALAAADAGADEVVVSEPNVGRAALMASLGFEVLDPTSTDVAEACRERREGGFEVVVECSGHPAGLTTGLDAVAPGGCVVQAGVIEQPVQLDAMRLMLRGVRLVGSVGYPLDAWPGLVDRLAGGGLPVERLVGGRVPLAGAVSGFERLAAGDGAVKLIVDVA